MEPSPHRRPGPSFFGVALFLALLLPLTWGLQAWQVGRVASSVRAQQDQAAVEALALIEQRFEDLQHEMLARARELAEAPVVVRGLRERARTEAAASPETLVQYLAREPLPEGWSAELWDYTPRLVAWNGFSMPLDDALRSTRFLERFQTAVTKEGSSREALVVWWPVREGTRVLGAVRVMRLLSFEAPVQNRYLYRMERVWERATHLDVDVTFGEPADVAAAGEEQGRLLQGVDGRVLGRVVVQPPAPDALVRSVGERFDHVLAFWAALLLGWLFYGLWLWYRLARSEEADAGAEGLLRALGRFAVVGAAWWGLRYALLALDVPARWQRGKAPLAPLFDPVHLASTVGGGLVRSTGDLLITALFALLFALAFVELASRFRARASSLYRLREQLHRRSERVSLGAAFLLLALSVVPLLLLTAALGVVTRRTVLDSTLDYFARTGLLPEALVLVVFCALLLAMLAAVLAGVGVLWTAFWGLFHVWPFHRSVWAQRLLVALAVALPVVVYALFGGGAAWEVALLFVGVAGGSAVLGFVRQSEVLDLLTLRSVLPVLFLLTLLVYPLFFAGMDAQRRMRMVDEADSFEEGRDARVLFALENVLQDAQDAAALPEALAAPDTAAGARLDSLADLLLQNSLLTSLVTYEVSVTFLDEAGRPVGRYFDGLPPAGAGVLDQADAREFDILHQMWQDSGAGGALVQQMTGRREPDRLQYEGILPVHDGDDEAVVGWVMVRAEPRVMGRDGSTPFLRVLLPASYYEGRFTNLSLAAFRDGMLVRSSGREFGRYRLSEEVHLALQTQAELWVHESVEERSYLTYYRRQETAAQAAPEAPFAPPFTTVASTPVVAVRVPAVNVFDHLYYLLRLTVSGLFVGLPLYLLGLFLRRRAGLLPARRVRFRDKVLNAFLGVGVIAVAAVGFVGLRVVTGENERAIQSWLRQRLERVEEMLVLDARTDEMPYHVLERTHVDTLAARAGLDLNIYRGERLVASSLPERIREYFIDNRLSAAAYEDLFFDGYRFTYTTEQVGGFGYRAGYHALFDEQGRTRYVVTAVPMLPEQERIEEERARTVAYLFGALLLLVVVVMLTASLLANALARPIARLRAGLKAVARGRFERVLPVDSRDEIGELVETFNDMQEQLAESRRKLAQQERQLAWREMARQVAHEIKNPLTPMKLSVQHLRRAHEGRRNGGPDDERFVQLFERITGTLIEQIDTLARIANEFHSFARMPTRVPERLDLNVVIGQAVALMQEEGEIEIVFDRHPDALVVEADREELRRIYINLIKNAIQAVPGDRDGQVVVRTTLVEEDDEPFAYSAVTDNGTGVPVELRDRIFEPNFSTKTSGTGLGLAIVRKSVEEIQGEIGFETETDVGSTFWIRLPLAGE